jgi:broad specificity phosphatase PhoE
VRLFLLARHGESLLNVAGLVNADPARDQGLSPLGEEEARDLGRQLAGIDIDIVVTSRFPRTHQTAALALGGREVAKLEVPALDDVRVGELEGKTIADYRAWKRDRPRSDPFPGGESLDDAAARYADAYRMLLARREQVLLVVCHEIPVRYAINAASGSAELDRPVHDVRNAVPYLFDERALAAAAEGIARLSLSVV